MAHSITKKKKVLKTVEQTVWFLFPNGGKIQRVAPWVAVQYEHGLESHVLTSMIDGFSYYLVKITLVCGVNNFTNHNLKNLVFR